MHRGWRQKKLIAVGRAWANGSPDPEEASRAQADMVALGAPAEVAREAAAAAEAEDDMAVWPENEGAVRVFLSMGTQWRRAGLSGIPTGLDYAALPAVCRAHRTRLNRAMLARIGVIETAALSAMLKKPAA